MFKKNDVSYLVLAAALGLGLGETAWAISLQQPAFAWPEWPRGGFLMSGALAGLGWALFAGASLRLSFYWDFGRGIKAGTLGLFPASLGWLWHAARRPLLPYPHDFPLRNLEILLATQCLLSLALTLGPSLARLARKCWPDSISPGRAAWRLFGLAWLVFMASSLWTGQWHVTGDAPHYLLITHSLAYDHDLELSGNYARGDWRLFYDRDELLPQVPPQKDGRIFPEHKPGLSLLLVPAYRLLGVAGVLWVLTGLAALGGALFYLLLGRLGFSADLKFWGWLLWCFTAPWWCQSQMVLAEVCGGLLCLVGLSSLRGALSQGWLPVACALLPWFSVRYNFLGLGLCAALGLRTGRSRWKRTALAGGALLLSFLALAWLESAHFGSLNPAEAYGQRHMGMKELFNPLEIPRHVCAILLDQEYGWLPFAPVFLLSFLGQWSWWRRDRLFFAQTAVLALLYLLPVAGFSQWYGDLAPNRYLVSLLPVWYLAAVEAWRAWGNRRAFAWLAGISWAWGLLMAVVPWLCWSKHTGEHTLLRVLGKMTGMNAAAIFPSFMVDRPSSYIWVAALALGLILSAWKLGPPAKSGDGPGAEP